jgi:phospholipid/cholesterol/gamma-HCH transport system permease protein
MEKTKQLLNHTSRRSVSAMFRAVESFGGAMNLTYATARALFKRPFYFRLFLDQCYQLGFKSLSLTSITALSTGMVMTLQFGLGLERFGGKLYVPKIVGLSILRELGPILTCLMLAGRVGSGIAAEIGSMKVTQQIDAIRALGTDPIKRIVIPRVLAMFILAPMCTLFADIVGIFGGIFIASIELNIPASFYFHEALVGLRMVDFLVGISKTFVFGLIIGITGCYFGLQTEGGTQGVGQSTTRAVVTSSSLVVIADFILTKVWWIYERGLQ